MAVRDCCLQIKRQDSSNGKAVVVESKSEGWKVASKLSEEIRGAIVQEVHSQLNPLKTTVERLDKTVRSLYSNGSGGPPGYIEMARKEDNIWKDELRQVIVSHGVQLTSVADFVKTHNQQDKERQKRQLEREERIRFWAPKVWKVGVGFLGLVMSTGIWGCHKVLPVARILWEHYLQDHPIVTEKLKNVSQTPDPSVYAIEKRQDAIIPRQP